MRIYGLLTLFGQSRDMGERGELPGEQDVLSKCGLGDKPAPQLIKAREYLSHT